MIKIPLLFILIYVSSYQEVLFQINPRSEKFIMVMSVIDDEDLEVLKNMNRIELQEFIIHAEHNKLILNQMILLAQQELRNKIEFEKQLLELPSKGVK